MNTSRWIAVGVLAVATLAAPTSARATWPSGASVTIPGLACAPTWTSPPYYHYADCPYVSDSFHEGIDVGQTDVDVYVDGSSNMYGVEFDDCYQSWTGTTVACGTTSEFSYDTGYIHLNLDMGFQTDGNTPSPWDYFYLEIGWGTDISGMTVFGYSFHDSNG
jgi:hypothetical protein